MVTLMEELFLVNALPSPSIIFNKLKETSKRQKQKIFKINDNLFLTSRKQDPVLVNVLPSPRIIINKLNEASKRQRLEIFKINSETILENRPPIMLSEFNKRRFWRYFYPEG